MYRSPAPGLRSSVTVFLTGGLLLAAGCAGIRPGPEGEAAWVASTLEEMSLRQQVASMVTVAVTAGFMHVDDPARVRVERQVRELEVGGVAMWGGDPYDQALVIDRLQDIAPRPLLVATDNEWGLGMRVGGSSSFPKAMALGATADTLLARQTGYITGLESRAVGIHMGYGPVADVNNNPLNPIINIRSFGEDPDLVAEIAVAWHRGAQRAGMLTTAKHFPGHGDVDVDSHIDLPVVEGDLERLERVELPPFKALIEQGVDAVMVAHLWLPAFDQEMIPATLSRNVVQGYLRAELGFRGLVVTDAMRMGAVVRNFGVGEAAVRAVEAGVDMLLLPVDAEATIDAIEKAVLSGRITAERIADSARRILAAKGRVGLHLRRQVPLAEVERVVGDPRVETLARTISRASMTLVRNREGLIPLGEGSAPAPRDTSRWTMGQPPRAEGPFTFRHADRIDSQRVVFLGLSSDPGSGEVGRTFFSGLRGLFPEAETFSLYPETDAARAAEVLRSVERASLVVAAVFSRVRDQKGHAAVVEPHAALLRYAAGRGIPVAVAAFGPPYFLMQFPGVDAYLAAYDYTSLAQTSAAEVFRGETGARGRLPVSLPGLYRSGYGLSAGPLPAP